jgi:TRAP-type C4-dicarboxylate transport system permease small subunit
MATPATAPAILEIAGIISRLLPLALRIAIYGSIIGFIGTLAYAGARTVIEVQPAVTQALQLATYAIPVMAYALTIQVVISVIQSVRALIAR